MFRYIAAFSATLLLGATLSTARADLLPPRIKYTNAAGPRSLKTSQRLGSSRRMQTFYFASNFCGVRIDVSSPRFARPAALLRLKRSLFLTLTRKNPKPLYARLSGGGLEYQFSHKRKMPPFPFRGLVHVFSTKDQPLSKTIREISGFGAVTIRQIYCNTQQAKAPSIPLKTPCGLRSTFQGRKTFSGTLYHTKGAQLMLNGHILSPFPGFKGRRYGGLRAGQRVTLRADVCVYRCHPMEQCLSGGRIPTLRNVRIVKKN